MLAPNGSPTANRCCPPGRQASAVALGVFIVWQLVFLVVANVLDFFPHRVHRLDELTNFRVLPAGSRCPWPLVHAVASVTDRWAHLTGQYQMWWLFAPDFPAQATFPVVELRWDDPLLASAPVRLPSAACPADRSAYFHAPTSADRLLQYEANLCLGYAFWNENSLAEDPVGSRQFQFDLVRSQWKSMRAYMRWRTAQFLGQRPDLPPPDEVCLLIRIAPTPAWNATANRHAPTIDCPFARWRCAENGSAEVLPVEVFDPLIERYVPLPRSPDQRLAIEAHHRHE
jgi:hypothetical protein